MLLPVGFNIKKFHGFCASRLHLSASSGHCAPGYQARQYLYAARRTVEIRYFPYATIVKFLISVIVGDFGVATCLEKAGLPGTVGTYAFLPPEQCKHVELNETDSLATQDDPRAADMWAVGVTMWVFLFGTLPFHASYLEVRSLTQSALEIFRYDHKLQTMKTLPKQMILLF